MCILVTIAKMKVLERNITVVLQGIRTEFDYGSILSGTTTNEHCSIECTRIGLNNELSIQAIYVYKLQHLCLFYVDLSLTYMVFIYVIKSSLASQSLSKAIHCIYIEYILLFISWKH